MPFEVCKVVDDEEEKKEEERSLGRLSRDTGDIVARNLIIVKEQPIKFTGERQTLTIRKVQYRKYFKIASHKRYISG